MFDHLLVPLDGSPLAESVLPAAAALAQKGRARVTLLHVVERTAPDSVHGTRHLRTDADAQEYLGDVRQWMQSHDAPATTRIEPAGDDVASAIARAARAETADLIVLCTHGARGVRGILFGRVAQQVLAYSALPVFLFPPATHAARTEQFAPRSIFMPLDTKHDPHFATAAAATLAREFAARITIMTVVNTVDTLTGGRGAASRMMPRAAAELLEDEVRDARAYLSEMHERLGAEGIDATCRIERGDPVRVLLDAIARERPDTIIMPTHGRAGMSVLWTGSVASRLVEKVKVPLLMVPAEDKQKHEA